MFTCHDSKLKNLCTYGKMWKDGKYCDGIKHIVHEKKTRLFRNINIELFVY